MPKRPNAPVSTDQNGFEEGNTYQYTFMIPFDYPALIQRIGGDDADDSATGQVLPQAHLLGRAVLQHGQRARLRHALRVCLRRAAVEDRRRSSRALSNRPSIPSPDGIPGNDDLGATSGVYVWNALGLYPGIPGVGGLLIGTPMFPSAAIHMGDGRTLSIRSTGTGPYVQQVLLDGKENKNSWLPLSALGRGTSTARIHTQPGTGQAARPARLRAPTRMGESAKVRCLSEQRCRACSIRRQRAGQRRRSGVDTECC